MDVLETTAMKQGLSYKQSYDAIVKWFCEEFKGKIFDLLGESSEPIEDVFTFEPVEIPMSVGRLDLIFKGSGGSYYHLEEQRNLSKDDLYRFASQHFQTAKHFGDNFQDIILASGDEYTGDSQIETKSGKYTPKIVDFTKRDGNKRLAEIKKDAENEDFSNLWELVFIPLYGKETQAERRELVSNVLQYEVDMLKKEKLYRPLFFATLIMSNKLLPEEQLKKFYEEVKSMLDILEIARKDGESIGLQKGETIGLQKGEVKGKFDILTVLLSQGILTNQQYLAMVTPLQKEFELVNTLNIPRFANA